MSNDFFSLDDYNQDKRAAMTQCPDTPAIAQPTGQAVHIENCDFHGKNKDGSEPFTFRVGADGLSEIASIRMVGWNCQGPAPAQPEHSAVTLDSEYMHKRTGVIYKTQSLAKMKSGDGEWQACIVYFREKDSAWFVRDLAHFAKNFELHAPQPVQPAAHNSGTDPAEVAR